MVKVLFVCLGNICRSPMAEAVFRKMVKERGLESQIEIDSAGTGDWHIGKPPHEGTRQLLTEKQIDFSGLTARQVKAQELDDVDYIIALDEQNEADLRKLSDGNERIIRLLDVLPDQPVRNVPDPYYTGNFDEVYELIVNASEKLLDKIVAETNGRR